MDDEILKSAQQQVAQAMNSAMGNIGDIPKSDEQSDFLKQNLSAEDMTEEHIDYVEPMQDPYKKAITYLENHNVMQMFQVKYFLIAYDTNYTFVYLWNSLLNPSPHTINL